MPVLKKYQYFFDSIYQFAKNQDEEGLKAFLKKTGAAVQTCVNDFTPISKLAKEGHKAAVEFLLKKFQANPNEALYGYAWGGHVKEVDELLEAGCFVHDAIEPYARGGYVDQVNRLLAEGGRLKYAVCGYALSGNTTQVNLLLAAGADRNSALHGYTIGRHIKPAEDLIAQGAYLDNAASDYAELGDTKKVSELIAEDEEPDDAVWGYAIGGHFECVRHLINELGASRNIAVEALAMNGYVTEVNKLIAAGASRKRALVGYARGINIEQVNQLIEAGESRDDVVLCYAAEGLFKLVNEQITMGADRAFAVEGYRTYLKDNQETVLRLAAYTDDVLLRKLLIKKGKEIHAGIDIDAMFEKATHLHKIMQDYAFTFNQAKVLLVTGAREWLLQGTELIRNGPLNQNVFNYITHQLTNFPTQKVEAVRTAVTEKLFSDTVESLSSQFKASFFAQANSKDKQGTTPKRSPEDCIKEQKQAGENFIKRMKI